MKKSYIFLLFLFLTFQAFCQQEIIINETTKPMSKGMQNGYVTEIPQAKLKEVSSAWKKFVKHDTKNSIELVDNEYIITGTIIQNISSSPINVYTYFLETRDGVRQTSFFSEDGSNFVSSIQMEEKSIAAKTFLHDFVVQQYKAAVKHELDLERKRLSVLEKALESLNKDKDNAKKSMNKNKRNIEKINYKIESNRKEQEARAAELTLQKETLRALANATGEEKILEEKKLNALEKEKKKLEKKSEKFHSEIEDLESDNKKLERRIEQKDDSLKEKKEEISSQKETNRIIERKMRNIK